MELKPCPFCGSPGEEAIYPSSINLYFYPRCSDRDCIARYLMNADFKTEKEAIEAWNRRVDDGEE